MNFEDFIVFEYLDCLDSLVAVHKTLGMENSLNPLKRNTVTAENNLCGSKNVRLNHCCLD